MGDWSKHVANRMWRRAFKTMVLYMGWDCSCDTYGSATAFLRWGVSVWSFFHGKGISIKDRIELDRFAFLASSM